MALACCAGSGGVAPTSPPRGRRLSFAGGPAQSPRRPPPLLNQARYLPLTPPARNIRKVLQMKYLPNRPAEVFVDEEVVE